MGKSKGKVIKVNFGNSGKLPTIKEKFIDDTRKRHQEIKSNIAKIMDKPRDK